MMCWTDDKTPWDKFPDIYISLLSSKTSSKHFTLKVPPQVYSLKAVRSHILHSEISNSLLINYILAHTVYLSMIFFLVDVNE